MKTKITLIATILIAIWFLNKVRIIVFGSMWWIVIAMVVIGGCVWLLSGGISRVPAIRNFIEKYGK